MALADIYRIFHLNNREYTFFSSANETLSKIHHILEHNASLNRYRKIEITSCALSDHNGLKLNIKNNRSSVKYTNSQKLKNSLLNENEVKTEIEKEIDNKLVQKTSWT